MGPGTGTTSTDQDAVVAAPSAGRGNWRERDGEDTTSAQVVADPSYTRTAPPADVAAKAAASVDFQTQFATALNVGFWEGLTSSNQDIIEARTPNQIMDAFSTVRPEWKDVMEQIKADPDLAKSLHNVLVKDPTMLDGFADMFSETGNANPADFSTALKDPKTRKALTGAFDKIAERDDLTFKDFRELYDNKDDQAKTMAKLKQMGVGMDGMMDMQTGLQMLNNFLRDPVGFLKELPSMLEGMGMIGPIQARAWENSSILEGAQLYAGLVLGPIEGDPEGYGGHLANTIERVQEYAESGELKTDLSELSGQADQDVLTGAAGNDKVDGSAGSDRLDTKSIVADGLEGNNSNVVALSVRSDFNPNAEGTRLDGYTPPGAAPNPAATVPGGSYGYLATDKLAATPQF